MQPFSELFDIELKKEIDPYEVINAAKTALSDLSQDLFKDLLRKRSQIELLRKQLGGDSMTQLYNYKRFNDLLDQEIIGNSS